MSFNEASILKKRAMDFLDEAGHLIDVKKYDLAVFNMEQYCELILKYKMLIRLGYYSGTSSLKELLNKLSELESNLNNFLNDEKNILYLGRLPDADISTRCVAVEFDEAETENIYNFVMGAFNKYVNKL